MGFGQTTIPIDQVYNLMRQPITPLVRGELVSLLVLDDIVDADEVGLPTFDFHHGDQSVVANVEHLLDGPLIEGAEGGGSRGTSFFNESGVSDSPTRNIPACEVGGLAEHSPHHTTQLGHTAKDGLNTSVRPQYLGQCV